MTVFHRLLFEKSIKMIIKIVADYFSVNRLIVSPLDGPPVELKRLVNQQKMISYNERSIIKSQFQNTSLNFTGSTRQHFFNGTFERLISCSGKL